MTYCFIQQEDKPTKKLSYAEIAQIGKEKKPAADKPKQVCMKEFFGCHRFSHERMSQVIRQTRFHKQSPQAYHLKQEQLTGFQCMNVATVSQVPFCHTLINKYM